MLKVFMIGGSIVNLVILAWIFEPLLAVTLQGLGGASSESVAQALPIATNTTLERFAERLPYILIPGLWGLLFGSYMRFCGDT